ncbi:ABC transporter substrate-binding protein [Paenibacillus oryzae]|uniref:ABC transporter substrate-binding protein n=1 Tax=Paenibacillus oryzae TaxID=1844972 RepID=A0A1A5YCW4_9BACL|nr:extracellular solute-binding protein [Paenibacillus oryzae]OBR63438.1 ABC transporter substrate-binding protein [Paenibacillus oryzae]
MKKGSWLAIVIALALTLTACGGGNGEKPGSGEKPSENGGEGGAKPNLTMLMQYSLFDPNADPVAKNIEDVTGYKITYEMLPAENGDEKLNLMVANNQNFDVMKLGAAQFYKLATAGALEPLDELIDSLGPNIKAAIKEDSWKSATIDGKIYAIPETGSGVSVGEELVVRQDWMDELNLKHPTTPDELYEVLKAIKAAKNVVPLTGTKDSIYGDIAAAFGVLNEWNDVDGTLVHKAELPQMKEFLSYMNKLYSEGLLDSEMPLNTAAKAIEKFSSGNAAMFKLAWWSASPAEAALKKNFPEAEIGIIPYLVGKDGKSSVGVNLATTWYIAVPKVSKLKEDAIKLIDSKLQKENFIKLAIGEEGVHHEVKDGKYYPILPKFNDDLANASSYMTGVNEHDYPTYWQARVRKDPVLQRYYEAFQENAAKGNIVIDPMSIAPPIEAVSKNKQKLTKLLDDAALMFIAGQPIGEYDAFLAQWKAEGGAEAVQQANDWYKSISK